MSDKSQIIIDSLKEIVNDANKLSADNAEIENQLVANFFQTKYQLEQKYDLELGSFTNDGIIELISMVSIPKKTSLFKLKVLTRFLCDSVFNTGLVDKLNSSQVEILFKCCQLQLDNDAYYFNGDGNKYDSNFYLWKGTLKNLVNKCGKNEFVEANINTIQDFYEYKSVLF